MEKTVEYTDMTVPKNTFMRDENGNIRPYQLGHWFIAIDTEHFMGEEIARKKAGDICRSMRASKKAPDAERIYTAGEKEYEIVIAIRILPPLHLR